MSSDCTQLPSQETVPSNRSRVNKRVVGSVSSSEGTISSSVSFSKGQEPCRDTKRVCPYNGRCTYGDRCRYRHPAPRVPPTCRHFLAGHCRYGDECRYRHPPCGDQPSPTRADEPQLADMTTFPSVGTVSSTTRPKLVSVGGTNSKPRGHSRQKHSKSSPPELQLEAFFKKAAVVSSRPVAQRPSLAVTAANTSSSLRAMEIEQMERQFQCQLVEKSEEESMYSIDFFPMDPEWKHASVLELLVSIPAKYPQKPLRMALSSACGLPEVSVRDVNAAIREEISSRHESCRLSGQFSLALQPLLQWLDSNISHIVGSLCQSDLAGPSPPLSDASDEEDESTEGEESGSDEESGFPGQHKPGTRLHHPKRGTEVRLAGLALSQNVGVLSCSLLKLTMQCTRCKHLQDVCVRPEQVVSELCSRCQCSFSLTLHANLVHSDSPSLAFLDLIGCSPVDVVLPSTQCQVSCLECGREQMIQGLGAGETWVSWCHFCHQRLAVSVEQCRFLLHQPGTQLAAPPSGTVHVSRKKEGKLQEGKPLPELGTCTHYKKSHRWLRFPCCGKAYPCDVCHDLTEDHPRELANRMICGYCSREQSYTASGPCISCGSDVTSTRSSTYWEGGQGCRNKAKMSRNDRHKYVNSAKTASKKQERVGAKGKSNALFK